MQLGHKKLLQSKQRATASDSLLLQPVQCGRLDGKGVLKPSLDTSRSLFRLKSGISADIPCVVRMHSCWQREQVTLSGCSWLFSKHE